MEITRETFWLSKTKERYLKIKIREMNDKHLVNAIKYIEEKDKKSGKKSPVLPVLKEETKIRRLSKKFLNDAPYPFISKQRYIKNGRINRYQWIKDS